MKRYRILFALLLFSLSAELAKASVPDSAEEYFSDKTLRYEDKIYVPEIKTVVLSPDPSVLAPPVISLNSTDVLYLSFDDLGADFKTYTYTLIHCTAKWEPSNALVSEYLDGFAQNPITDYQYSRSTLQKYTHYSASFPNENVKLTKSGNYLLKVYTDNDEDSIVFTRRFLVYENNVTVDASVHAATIVSDRNFKQEVDFNIGYNQADIANPYSQIYPVILQNFRWDNAISGLQPQFVKDGQLVYDYDDVNVFSGGNEFRNFDTRSLRYKSERVEDIEKDSNNLYHVYLLPDDKRAYKRFSTTN
ncbi:MAG TPA: DUF5103 domain-containing protein, partial [Bacteroidia bacterium]|nr:DUF5103 domain-containing protein [Bacteroidia bacterium]